MIKNTFANTLLMQTVCGYQSVPHICNTPVLPSTRPHSNPFYNVLDEVGVSYTPFINTIGHVLDSQQTTVNPGFPRVQRWKMTCTPVYSLVASSGSIHTVTLSTGTSLLPSTLFSMSAGMFWLQVILSSSLSCSSLFTCRHTHGTVTHRSSSLAGLGQA